MANFLVMALDLVDRSLGIFDAEDTQVDFSHTEIRAYAHAGNGNKGFSEEIIAFFLKDFAHFLLEEAIIFLLARRIHASKVRKSMLRPNPKGTLMPRSAKTDRQFAK